MLGTVLGDRNAVENKVYMFPNPNRTHIPVGEGIQMQIKQNKHLKYKFNKYNLRNKGWKAFKERLSEDLTFELDIQNDYEYLYEEWGSKCFSRKGTFSSSFFPWERKNFVLQSMKEVQHGVE